VPVRRRLRPAYPAPARALVRPLHIMLRCVSVLNTHCQGRSRYAWSSQNLARNVRTSLVSRRRVCERADDRRCATKFDRTFQLKTGDLVAKPGTTVGLFTSRR